MASIYELTGTMLQLMSMLYDEDVDEKELLAACEAVELQIEDKADGYAKVIKNMDADIKGLQAEERRLKERRQSLERRKVYLSHNLEQSMKAIGKTKFKTDLFSFSIAKNPAKAEVRDEHAFIEWCEKSGRDDLLRFKEPEINKTALKDAILKDGEVIDGAEIVQTEGLRIR